MLVDGRMSHNLSRCWIVFLLNQLRVPLYCYMALLKEVRNQFGARFDDTARASLDPVTLATTVALPVHHLEHEWLQCAIATVGKCLLPVWLVPPKTLVRRQIRRVALQYDLSRRPDLFVYTVASWLCGHLQQDWRRQELWLIFQKRPVLLLSESSMIRHRDQRRRYLIVIHQ